MKTPCADVLVLAHGWGYDPSFFNPMLNALHQAAPDWLAQCLVVGLDQGYFSKNGEGSLRVWQGSNWVPHPAETLHGLVMGHADARWVGIGHSLGFAHLLSYAVKWHKLVSVAGFTHFCSQGDLPGSAPRVVQRMLSQLQTHPAQVLTAFQQKAGFEMQNQPALPTPLKANHPLMEDLASMVTLNCAAQLQDLLKHGTQVLAFDHPNDNILKHSLDGLLQKLSIANATHCELATNPSRYTQALTVFLTQEAS